MANVLPTCGGLRVAVFMFAVGPEMRHLRPSWKHWEGLFVAEPGTT